MDVETLKLILDLQHNVSMANRILGDIFLALNHNTKNGSIPDYNYHVNPSMQSCSTFIIKEIRRLRSRVEELEERERQTSKS